MPDAAPMISPRPAPRSVSDPISRFWLVAAKGAARANTAAIKSQ
jgi:hypothetical protein